MATELYDPLNIFAPAFAFDADLSWHETHEYSVTGYKVEGKGEISDHVATKPFTATVEGKVTAMTVSPSLPDPQKLINARADLEALAAKRALVLVLSDLCADYLVIQRAEIHATVSEGKSLMVKISLRRVETTTVGTTQVPASRLKAKVKKRAAPGKSGGASSGSGSSGSMLSKLDDLTGRGLSGLFR